MVGILRRALTEILSPSEVLQLCSGFDIIGDIAILKISNSLLQKKEIIANVLLQNLKSVKTVLRQVTPISGDYRIREVEYILGERKTTTLYKEFNCLFKVDVATVYFSPRLSSERYRIAKQIGTNETVINMFAGIGLFSILIAKIQPSSFVHSIDINPHAYELMGENVRINKVANRVKPILGDAALIIESSLGGSADRIIMPLPEKAKSYLNFAIKALKQEGGIIHYYTHIHADKSENPLEKARLELDSNIDTNHNILNIRKVREVGPRWYQIVIDVHIKR